MNEQEAIRLVRVEERQAALRDDLAKAEIDLNAKIEKQAARIDKQDGNIRFVVLAVLGAVITAVINLVTKGAP